MGLAAISFEPLRGLHKQIAIMKKAFMDDKSAMMTGYIENREIFKVQLPNGDEEVLLWEGKIQKTEPRKPIGTGYVKFHPKGDSLKYNYDKYDGFTLEFIDIIQRTVPTQVRPPDAEDVRLELEAIETEIDKKRLKNERKKKNKKDKNAALIRKREDMALAIQRHFRGFLRRRMLRNLN